MLATDYFEPIRMVKSICSKFSYMSVHKHMSVCISGIFIGVCAIQSLYFLYNNILNVWHVSSSLPNVIVRLSQLN